MKILFFGDLQLEAGRTLGVGDFGEGSRPHDQTLILDRIAETAIGEHVGVVCCLGDLFDRPEPAPWAMLAFQRFVKRLRSEGVELVILLGNHEVKSAELPCVLELYRGDGVTVSLSPRLIPVGDVVFATLPWTPLSVLVAEQGRTPNLRRDAIELLVKSMQHLRLACASEYPDAAPILLGHWAVSGSTLPSGSAIEERLSEPIIPWDEIDVLGWKLAAFGHIHQPQVIGAGAAGTPIFYVGSPAVSDLGEIGSPHGVWVFDDERDELRFVAIADRAFIDYQTHAIDFGPGVGVGLSPLPSDAPSVSGAVVRVRYRAEGLAVDEARVRADLLRMGAHKVFIKEVDRQVVSRARVTEVSEYISPAEALSLYIRSQGFEGPEQDVKVFLDALHEAHVGYMERAA